MGMLICRLLSKLACPAGPGNPTGRIVLASIHGPSGRMLKAFSHLLVLTENGGRVAFHGPTGEAEAFFASALGVKRPPELNAAEFLLSAVSDLQCVDDDDAAAATTTSAVCKGGRSSTNGGSNNTELLVRSDAPARVAAAFDAAQPPRRSSGSRCPPPRATPAPPPAGTGRCARPS